MPLTCGDKGCHGRSEAAGVRGAGVGVATTFGGCEKGLEFWSGCWREGLVAEGAEGGGVDIRVEEIVKY